MSKKPTTTVSLVAKAKALRSQRKGKTFIKIKLSRFDSEAYELFYDRYHDKKLRGENQAVARWLFED